MNLGLDHLGQTNMLSSIELHKHLTIIYQTIFLILSYTFHVFLSEWKILLRVLSGWCDVFSNNCYPTFGIAE